MKKWSLLIFVVFVCVVGGASFSMAGDGTTDEDVQCKTMGVPLDVTNTVGGRLFVVSEHTSWPSSLACWSRYSKKHCKDYDKYYVTDTNFKIDIVYKPVLNRSPFETVYLTSGTIDCKM